MKKVLIGALALPGIILLVLFVGFVGKGLRDAFLGNLRDGKKDPEARAAAQRIWDRLYAKCGESYYQIRGDGRLWQYRGDFQFWVSHDSLSDAERANGVEWAGSATFSAKLEREAISGVWGRWSDNVVYSIGMVDEKGIWSYSLYDYPDRLTDLDKLRGKPSCAAVTAVREE